MSAVARESQAASQESDAPPSNDIDEVTLHVHIESSLIVDVDSRGLDVLGYETDEIVGRSIFDFVHEEDQRTALAAAGATRKHRMSRCVVRILEGDGGHRRVSCLLVLSSDGETAWIRALDQDQVARTGETYWQYSRLSDLTTDHFVVTDRSGLIVHANASACELYGMTETVMMGKRHKDLAATAEGRRNIEDNCRAHLEHGRPVRFHVPVIAADGRNAILECNTLWDDLSQRWYTIERDVTEQVRKDRELAIGKRFFDATHDQLALLDKEGHLLRVNPAFEDFVGVFESDLIGRLLSDVLGASSRGMLEATIDWVHDHQRDRRLVVQAEMDHGERMLSVTLRPDPDASELFMSARDITEELRLADELKDRATHDQLTRLPTRDVFNDSLDSVLRSGFTAAVMMLDIDDFKHVNDSLGHDAGDELLIIIGARLRAALRSDDVVARFGGDEFVVLLRGARAVDDAESIAEKVRVALAAPYRVANREVHVSASIGLAIGSSESHNGSQLLSEADTAAYEAKHRGRNQVQVFGPVLANRSQRRVAVEETLRKAIDNEDVDCDVQGVYRSDTNELVGVEVFARLECEELGRVGPSYFLDVAKHLGLLGALGEQVIDSALRALRPWLTANPELWVAINADAEEVAGSTYVQTLHRLTKRHRVDPSRVVIELCDAEVGGRASSVSRALSQLAEKGFRICIDDFGAGATALGSLRSATVHRVKLDTTYVRALVEDETIRTVVQAIIELGSSLGVEVAAETIESEVELTVLKEMGCDLVQGFHLHRPVPVDEFVKLALSS